LFLSNARATWRIKIRTSRDADGQGKPFARKAADGALLLGAKSPRASLIADLHREVENLERDYEDAILAMGQANR
jgi:hypothetical protein